MPDPALLPARNLYDIAALRALEARAADALGDPFELMRRAGRAAWRELLARWPQARRVLVVCGPGHNGGDGCVLAAHALRSGREVAVVRLPAHAPRGLAMPAEAMLREAGGHVQAFEGGLPDADVAVDALFGIGLARAPDADTAQLIAAINTHPAPVLALDVPSGVDAATGAVPGAAVEADCTLEFLLPKAGLRSGRALDHVGALALAMLDHRPAWCETAPAAYGLQAEALAHWLAPRRRDSHKGRHGRVLCVGGDHGSGGALLLCAEAALRCGAGWVELATREAHVVAALARLPEAMSNTVESGEALVARLPAADALALGPGLGQQAWGRGLLRAAAHAPVPAVWDADALNLLAAGAVEPPHGAAVLTPHPGEAARLLKCDAAAVQRDRFAAAHALAQRFGAVVVLKGAGTVVTAPERTPCVIEAGNPGMAVAGMGDVLTGVIAALLAQGLSPFDAACAGALLHADAGDAAARDGERGLLPTDLMPWLRRQANPEPRA
ncbi:MAG TPA: NAD(P)H-hydrate dehydratase [Lysobacter sp.]|nr:NAD(P)H-hydrate dehydratase [Lysobacter sp.]